MPAQEIKPPGTSLFDKVGAWLHHEDAALKPLLSEAVTEIERQARRITLLETQLSALAGLLGPEAKAMVDGALKIVAKVAEEGSPSGPVSAPTVNVADLPTDPGK